MKPLRSAWTKGLPNEQKAPVALRSSQTVPAGVQKEARSKDQEAQRELAHGGEAKPKVEEVPLSEKGRSQKNLQGVAQLVEPFQPPERPSEPTACHRTTP
jgi:hypothetical protein